MALCPDLHLFRGLWVLEEKGFTESLLSEAPAVSLYSSRIYVIGNKSYLFIFNKMGYYVEQQRARCCGTGTQFQIFHCLQGEPCWLVSPLPGPTHPTAMETPRLTQARSVHRSACEEPGLLLEMWKIILCFIKIRTTRLFSANHLSFSQKFWLSDRYCLNEAYFAKLLAWWRGKYSNKVQAAIQAFFMKQHIVAAFIQKNFWSSNSTFPFSFKALCCSKLLQIFFPYFNRK